MEGGVFYGRSGKAGNGRGCDRMQCVAGRRMLAVAAQSGMVVYGVFGRVR